ncbi:hypothetical protein GCM10022287_16720 [Gryllotalpicola koreensis]|uniref:Uncharacterized protein n=2 Tax=Gryllotalpicola koreensis TaxID=993086 RepID=A0ABP7ZYV3_9MICO
MPHPGYLVDMSDELNDDKHNTQGVPSEDGSSDADTASGGAPDENRHKDVDPDTGTDENDAPVENPSGG